MTPFDYVNSINNKTEVEDFEEYNRFVIDLAFSYFKDTILIVNELNKYSRIPNEQHYDFLNNVVSKKKRFSKWHKKELDDDLNLIQELYNVSLTKAKQYRKILTKSDMEYIRNMKGGKDGK